MISRLRRFQILGQGRHDVACAPVDPYPLADADQCRAEQGVLVDVDLLAIGESSLQLEPRSSSRFVACPCLARENLPPPGPFFDSCCIVRLPFLKASFGSGAPAMT